jgi:hypothetical protein
MHEQEKDPSSSLTCTVDFCMIPGTDPEEIIREEIKCIDKLAERPANQQGESC